MKRKALFIIFFTLASYYSQAQNNTGKDLMKLIYDEPVVNKMVDAYKNYFNEIATKLYPDGQDDRYVKFMEYTMDRTKVIINKMIENDLPGLYETHFNNTEIEELCKFFRSSIGKKYATSNSVISEGIMQIMIEKYIPELQAELQVYLQNQK